jgi:hypothetical protein
VTRSEPTTSPSPSAAPGDRTRSVDRGPWPASPLAAVGRAFDLLVCPPTAYLLDGAAFPGLPDEHLDLHRVRGLLLSPAVHAATRDEVWREVVARSRRPGTDGQAWTVIAAGMALPGLTAAAARLCRGWRGETADIDAEVLAGFVARLKTLDASGPRVVGRLIDAGIRAGRRARNRAGDADLVRVDAAWSSPPAHPWDHPDWVLARAVAAGVLDRTEARLIGATRLEDVPLVEAATALRVDPQLAADWRYRAEGRLRDAVTAGELDASRTVVPRPAGQRRHAARLALVKAERIRRRHRVDGDRPGGVGGVGTQGAVTQFSPEAEPAELAGTGPRGQEPLPAVR